MKNKLIFTVLLIVISTFTFGEEKKCFYIVNKTNFDLSYLSINNSPNLLRTGQVFEREQDMKINLTIQLNQNNIFTIFARTLSGQEPFTKINIVIEHDSIIELRANDYSGSRTFPPLGQTRNSIEVLLAKNAGELETIVVTH